MISAERVNPLLCIVFLPAILWSTAVDAAEPPNVLLIAVDDLNDWVGPLGGHPAVKTPNFDRLAKQGTTFTNAHCQSPLCNPSRTSFLLSLRPSTTGIYALEPSHYALPELKPILEPTYGVITYQEQVMRLAQVLAGISLAEADVLRKAVGKKDAELIRKELDKFVEKAVARGFDKHVIADISAQIETFGRYGFNKSHSVAYSILSYHTAYLKTHYAPEFMAALLSACIGDTDAVEVRLDGTGGFELTRQRRGDTTDVMLDYVGYRLDDLRAAYRAKVAAAALPPEEAGRLDEALESGLTGYTYLDDAPLA